MALTAVFITNPFIALKGTYNGLFLEETNTVEHARAGYFTAMLADSGAFTGKLTTGGKTYSFSSAFNLEGQANATINRPGTNALNISLSLDLSTNSSQHITGIVNGGSWIANLEANRTANPTTHVGKYTLLLPGEGDPAARPVGDSFGTVSITAAGATTVAGTLADGTKLSQKTSVSKDGVWPLYAPLYSNKGLIMGWMTNQMDGRIEGVAYWIKPVLPTAKHYRNGFIVTNNATGSRYQPPTNTMDFVLGFTDGIAVFSDGNLASPFTNHFTVTTGNKITSTNKMTVSLTTASGLIKGSVTPPGATKAVPFQGAIHKIDQYGAGFFLGTNQSGGVMLLPAN